MAAFACSYYSASHRQKIIKKFFLIENLLQNSQKSRWKASYKLLLPKNYNLYSHPRIPRVVKNVMGLAKLLLKQ